MAQSRSGNRGVVAYVCAVTLTAVTLLGLLAARWGAPDWKLVALFGCLYLLADTTPTRAVSWSVTAGSLILMTAAFATSPITAAVAASVGALSLDDWKHRRRGDRLFYMKVAFNGAQGILHVGAASTVFHLLARQHASSPVLAVVACLTAAVTALAINVGLMSGVLAVSRARSFLGGFRDFAWVLPNCIGFALVALMVAAVQRQAGGLAVVFLVAPLVVLRLVHRAYDDLEQAHTRTLHAFIRAVELKDPYTRGHSERVAEIAREMHRRLGADDAELKALYQGALLHDIGKVGVSGRILSKPGRLTANEFSTLKHHAVLGAEIAKDIEFLVPQLPQIRSHHERLDGKGYPDGLAGDEIPFEARVLAVADTYDALTSDRPYRSGCPESDALDEIRRVTGTQLDPKAVDVLAELLADGFEFTLPIRTERPVLRTVARSAASTS